MQLVSDHASLFRHLDGACAQVLETRSSGGWRRKRYCEIFDIESQDSQLLAETIVQFSGNPTPLLLLSGHQLGRQCANFRAVRFRQRLQPLALGEVREERHGELDAGLIDGAQSDFEGKPRTVVAAAFEFRRQ